jgi:cAMP-dependent protein kinase regulator
MGSAASTWQPPSDDTKLTKDEVIAIVGQDKFDQDAFDAAVDEEGFVTAAQLKNLVTKGGVPNHHDDSEQDEEDDDVHNTLPDDYVPPVMKKGGRKTGVSAESMDPTKMKEQMKNITCIEKSPEIYANLLKVVAKSPLLRALDQEQKDMIVKAFSGPLIKQPGEDIIVQGDIGDVFYLLEEGAVDVHISKGGNPPIKVHTYKPGDAFGELAIMYNAPRAATCRAQTEAKLWALDRVSFKCIVVAAAMQKRETYKGFLQNVPILKSLNEMEVMTLADSLAEEKYEDGEQICCEGDEGNYFYIVKDGTAICYKDGVEVLRLSEGSKCY